MAYARGGGLSKFVHLLLLPKSMSNCMQNELVSPFSFVKETGLFVYTRMKFYMWKGMVIM